MFDRFRIVKKWDKIILSSSKELFPVYSIKKETWGYNLMIVIPPGKRFEDLQKFTEALRVNIPCEVEMGIRKLTKLANVKLITKDFTEKKYEPMKLKSYEIFLGYDMLGKPIIVDMNRFPHVLIAGATGSGKSRLVFIILTNLIYNDNADIYLTQIRKRDLKKFQPYAKGYAETEAQTAEMFTKITKEIGRRVNYLDEHGYENIEECKHMRYIYVFGDEFSFYMEDKTDDEELKRAKQVCLSKAKEIIKTGRSVGVFLVLGVQKTTSDELLPLLKSQMRCKIAFCMTSENNSQNIIETSDAYMLPNREFILLTHDLKRCKTPYIDKDMIKVYLPYKEVIIAPEPSHGHFVPCQRIAKTKGELKC